MTTQTNIPAGAPAGLAADLDYAARIASEGAHTPLLGGPIGLMWGVLIAATMTAQYLILERIVDVPLSSLGFLWVAFAVIGGLGVFIQSRRQVDLPGVNSVANRVEQSVWTMFAGMTATLALGVILNQLVSDGTPRLWDLIVVAVFAGQGMAYGIVAKTANLRWLHLAALGSFVMAALTFSVYGSNTIYLLAAIGAVVTVILPSLRTMKAAA